MADFGKQLGRELDEIRDAGLWRELREIESAQSARIKFGGREFINFSSNDYLGLAAHPALGRAVREAVEQFGVGSGAHAVHFLDYVRTTAPEVFADCRYAGVDASQDACANFERRVHDAHPGVASAAPTRT